MNHIWIANPNNMKLQPTCMDTHYLSQVNDYEDFSNRKENIGGPSNLRCHNDALNV